MKNKILMMSVCFIFVIQLNFIENVYAELIPVVRDADNGIYYLNTERCEWLEDDSSNGVGIVIVRRMKKSESGYTELFYEFKRDVGYSNKSSFADFRIPAVWFYDKNGKLQYSDIQENLPFKPATYGSVADYILGAMIKYLE